jgi:enoyl-CoA hydratase/carnithine racemase
MNFIKVIQVSKNVLELRISRPEALNALNATVLDELRGKLREIKEEFQISKKSGNFREDFPRALLISGEGGKQVQRVQAF